VPPPAQAIKNKTTLNNNNDARWRRTKQIRENTEKPVMNLDNGGDSI